MDVASVSHPGQVAPAAPDGSSPNWLLQNKELIRTVKNIDAAGVFGDGNELTFGMDEDTKRPVIRVIDRQTNEVLWQAPPEYVLRLAEILGKPSGSHG